MIRLAYFFILVLLFEKCQIASTNGKKREASHESSNIHQKNEFTVYYTKDKIPKFILDSLSIINGSKFEIGDSTDKGKISFSDANIKHYKYSRMLHFVCLSDTISIISYKQGGIGAHDIIDVFYNIDNTHKRFLSNSDLSTLDSVINFLHNN